MVSLKHIWTDKSKAQLKHIHHHLTYEKKTPQELANVVHYLIEANRGVRYLGAVVGSSYILLRLFKNSSAVITGKRDFLKSFPFLVIIISQSDSVALKY